MTNTSPLACEVSVNGPFNGGTASHSASMTFQILTTGAPTFNYVMETDNTCATSANVRLFLERKNDDLTQEFYRWWANSTIYELQPTSENVTMAVPLTPDQWSSVYGKPGNLNATTLTGFHDALTNLGHVGMTFGGGCFAGHGVNVSDGSERAIRSYKLFDLVRAQQNENVTSHRSAIAAMMMMTRRNIA